MAEKKVKLDVPIHKVGDIDCIRIRDIEDGFKKERFEMWMDGQTRPVAENFSVEEQDFCYVWDYINFLRIDKAKGAEKKVLDALLWD